MDLGIDIGTSSVKVSLVGEDGQVAASADAPLLTSRPEPDASEQHPEDWWRALRLAMSTLADQADLGRVAAIGLCGQMHGAVLLDADRNVLAPVMLWNDGRAELECAEIAAELPEIGQIAGIVPLAGLSAPKMLWLSKHRPDTHRRIAHVLMAKDWIGMRLHGGLVSDPSDAAGTLWFDEAQGVWSPEACRASACDPGWLPGLRYGSDVAGRLTAAAAAELGLTPGITVAAGAGDTVAGAVALGAVAPGITTLSLGTSGQLWTATDAYRPAPDDLLHAYAHTLPGLWYQMAAMLNGARPMAWLAGLLNRPIEELLAMAAQAPSGPVFLPYLAGERTPHGDTSIRAGFWGLGEDATPGSLMRAVVEGIAYSFADARDAMVRSGVTPGTLLATGGGTRSDLLLQTLADAMGTRIGRADGSATGPALGAARLARMARTGASAAEVCPEPANVTWFEPDPDTTAGHAERLRRFRALYPAVNPR